MNVYIDAPKKRSLSPNERKIYELLCQGLTPEEISEKIHMRLQNDPYLIYSDIPPDTVIGLMTSIREKGWDIPENNEEENNMPRGDKTPDEKIAEIHTLRNEGKSISKISEETGVPQSTVQRICHRLTKLTEEKEPAPAATGTSSEVETCENVSANSIAENTENVKGKIPQAVLDALNEEIIKLKSFIDCDNEEIIELTEKINEKIEHITRCENRISEVKCFIDDLCEPTLYFVQEENKEGGQK